MPTGHRLDPLRENAPAGTRVLIVEPDHGYVIDYTRTAPKQDPEYGWTVLVGNRLFPSVRLSCCYEVPDSVMEQLT